MKVAVESVAGHGTVQPEWEVVKFPAVVFFQEGPGLRKWQWTNQGMKVINVTNILGDGRIDTANTHRFISLDEFNEKYRHFAVDDGDIVIASSGNTYGKVGRISAKDLPVMMNTSVIRLCSADKRRLDDDFLYAFLRSDLFRNQMESFVVGSAQPNFGPSHLKQMVLPLPPLPLQRRIADILSAYDELIENNQRRIKILEEMARSLYREWFVHFRFPGHEKVKMVPSPLGPIPQGWEVKRLKDIADLRWGDTSKTKASYVEEGYATYSATGLDGKMDHYDFDRKGIVLSAIGANCGKTWFASGKWSCIKNTIRFWSTSEAISTEFLFIATLREDFWPRRGAAQPFISQADAGQAQVICPDSTTMAAFTSLANATLKQIAALTENNSNLRCTRDLLLPRLLSGEVGVTRMN